MIFVGNVYYIQNICDRDAILFFAQARKMATENLRDMEQDESEEPEPRSRSKSAVGRSTRRGSSETVHGDEPDPKPLRRGT